MMMRDCLPVEDNRMSWLQAKAWPWHPAQMLFLHLSSMYLFTSATILAGQNCKPSMSPLF